VKVGCTAWAFADSGYGAPYEPAIDAIASLGFSGVELVLWSEADIRDYYTPNRIRDLRKRIHSQGLTLSEFALFDSVVGDLASLNAAAKARALRNFEHGARIAHELGTDKLNMVAAWARGLQGPTAYPPQVIYTQAEGQELFSPKWELQLPSDFDWAATWSNYVDSIKSCLQIAERYDLRIALEGHTHVIVSHTDAFLRLFDHVPSETLGSNFDTGWQAMQREYLPMSIHKLGQKMLHLHARDTDGLLNYSLPPGLGIIDWDAVVDALHAVGYAGFLSCEIGRYKDPGRWLRQARQYLDCVLAEHGYA
jgi:sugar phosphate isomerase/epimerase